MYYLTQILKHKTEPIHVMFLGFSNELKKTHYLKEDLEEVTNVSDDYEAFEPYPFLIDVGFFGGVNLEILLDYVDNNTLKLFIQSGGRDNQAKATLQKQLNYP